MDEATAKTLIATRRTMAKVQKACDDRDLPYPPELVEYLTSVLRYRNGN